MGQYCEDWITDKDGTKIKKCHAYATKESIKDNKPRCVLHSGKYDPATLGKLGGIVSKRLRKPEFKISKPPANAEDVQTILEQALYNQIKDELTPDMARSIKALSDSLIKTYEITDIQRRLDKIEQALKERDKQ